jgi:YVTN family beta-propeller protein
MHVRFAALVAALVVSTRLAAADALPEDAGTQAPAAPVAAPVTAPAPTASQRLVATLVQHVPAGKQPTTSLLTDGGKTLLVTNRGDNTVSVFKTDDLSLVKTIPEVGYSAWGLADRGNGKIVVANWAGPSLALVDVTAGKRTGELPAGMKPSYLALSHDGKRVYAAGNFSSDLTATDLATKKIVRQVEVGTRPMGVAESADGKTLYVAACGSKSIVKVDAASMVVLDRIDAPLAATTNLVLTPDGRTLLAAGEGGKLLAVDTGSNRVDAIPVGSDLSSVAVTPDGTLALAADYSGGTVSLVDLGAREKYATVAAGVGTIDVQTDGRRAYACNDKSGTISVFRLDPPASP